MQSSKEKQGEIRKPSSLLSAEKQRKTTEWERLRGPFKIISDTKGIFHAKMGTVKDINRMDLAVAEEIKRWQEYTD